MDNKIFLLFISLTSNITCINGSNGYSPWSPDGIKDLWCPKSSNCNAEPSPTHIDHCCACDALPEWEMLNYSPQYLSLEITNVKGSSRLIHYTVPANNRITFIHTNGILSMFPENVCNFSILYVDVSWNQLRSVGNITCLTELDTLIMKNNKVTYISNQTFVGLTKLRIVDFSYNLISKLDYNIFGSIHIMTFNFEGNYLAKLDVSNVLIVNKTICGGSYANNRNPIEMTNIGQSFLGEFSGFICGDSDFSNVSINEHPIFTVSEKIDQRTIRQYAPCGKGRYSGLAYDCDCKVAEFFHLQYYEFSRIYSKEYSESHCRSPSILENIRIEDLYFNQTLRDYMTCDIIDSCPTIGDCKCECTAQPNQFAIIVNCSNQSCTDFPATVPTVLNDSPLKSDAFSTIPDVILKHDIILDMGHNKISNVHPRHAYFSRVRTLDLRHNPIKTISDDISNLKSATDIILMQHKLNDLPQNIRNLEPDIFHFGKNGIQCSCENRWIGEWRLFKDASKHYPYALLCANYKNKTFEDMLNEFSECYEIETYYWTLSFIIPISLLLTCFWMYQCLHFEFMILKKRIFSSEKNQKSWETDVYISFDDDSLEIRYFVLVILEQFFKRKKMTTYIPCRDAWLGRTEEDNIKCNMNKCKYGLVIQSSGMYDSDKSGGFTRRMEYILAWDLFTKNKIKKILILTFDSKTPQQFKSSRSRALFRYGLGFVVPNRTNSLYDKIVLTFDEPLIVNSKYKVQRSKQIQNNLWKNKTQTDVTT
ncbi:Hypothetical predicted protein [Mytilus galloprovincialis]|uniref:TIR domain-containing protein n=1 Tax=Mytilus galloprovincialis TaxID=29158 RepID=A0A8B6FIC2_MYTGA|nr:Hypothetical predicted protein [Mytilus galloprovincialis]